MKRVETVDTSLAAGSARSGLQKYHPRLLDSPSRRKSILKKESISHDFDCSSTVHYSTISPGVALRFYNRNHGGPNYPTDRIDENTTNGSDHSRVMSSSRTSKSTAWEPLSPTVRLYHRNKVRNSSLGAAGVDKPPIYNIESDLNVKRIYNRRPSSNKEESNSSLVRVDEGMMGKSKPERHSSCESFKSSWYSSNLSNLGEEPQLQSSISLRSERCYITTPPSNSWAHRRRYRHSASNSSRSTDCGHLNTSGLLQNPTEGRMNHSGTSLPTRSQTLSCYVQTICLDDSRFRHFLQLTIPDGT